MNPIIEELETVQEEPLAIHVSKYHIVALVKESLYGDVQYVITVERPNGAFVRENTYNYRFHARIAYRNMLRLFR